MKTYLVDWLSHPELIEHEEFTDIFLEYFKDISDTVRVVLSSGFSNHSVLPDGMTVSDRIIEYFLKELNVMSAKDIQSFTTDIERLFASKKLNKYKS